MCVSLRPLQNGVRTEPASASAAYSAETRAHGRRRRSTRILVTSWAPARSPLKSLVIIGLMYLWQGNKDTLYRIHGTNEPWTIGTNVSSGCIRLTNEDIVDLYNRTPIGAKVIVLATAKPAAATQ